MSEQQTHVAQAETMGDRWGDPISAERQAELQGYLDDWVAETDHGERKGPFDPRSMRTLRIVLTGADVFWLAQQVRTDMGIVPDLHLEGANLIGAHLEGAFPPTAPPTRRARRGSLAAFRQQRRAQEGRWTRRATATPSTPSAPSPS
jgi:hypothetical protein